jgi:EmrB/QacA subfamily drug resistance transporter
MAVSNPETTAAARPHLGWVLGLTSTAYFMVVLDSVVVITALPRMQRDLHAGLASLQWTLTAYNIAFAAGIITAAAVGDRFGRRRIFTIGLALFTVASAACALAPNASELIAARTVQGLGGAIVLPLSLTILTTAFPAGRRGMIVGIYGGLAGLAVAMGPIVGGAVTQGIGWHWIFWINVPIGAVALPLAMRLLPDSYGAPERLDLPGVTLLTGGVVAIVWALVRANQSGWASAEIVSCLVSGAVLLLAFAAWEQRVSEPMVPLRLFRSRAFAFGNATTFLMTGAIFAAGFLITQEFQLARGYSPVSAGVRLLPFFATPMFISPIAGAVSDRIGRRPVMATGLFLQTAGFAWVAIRGSLSTNWVELDIALLIAGVGVSMALPTVPTAVLNAVAPRELGKASGINYMMQRFGAVFAIAVASDVFASYGHLGTPAGVTDGFKPALAACAGFALLAALSALAIAPPKTQHAPRPRPRRSDADLKGPRHGMRQRPARMRPTSTRPAKDQTWRTSPNNPLQRQRRTQVLHELPEPLVIDADEATRPTSVRWTVTEFSFLPAGSERVRSSPSPPVGPPRRLGFTWGWADDDAGWRRRRAPMGAVAAQWDRRLARIKAIAETVHARRQLAAGDK